jgi:hypothetical protein
MLSRQVPELSATSNLNLRRPKSMILLWTSSYFSPPKKLSSELSFSKSPSPTKPTRKVTFSEPKRLLMPSVYDISHKIRAEVARLTDKCGVHDRNGAEHEIVEVL